MFLQLRYNAPTLLPTGATVEMELEFVARNMLGRFIKINKRKICCILLFAYITEYRFVMFEIRVLSRILVRKT
jgi:hypothetical protein